MLVRAPPARRSGITLSDREESILGVLTGSLFHPIFRCYSVFKASGPCLSAELRRRISGDKDAHLAVGRQALPICRESYPISPSRLSIRSPSSAREV